MGIKNLLQALGLVSCLAVGGCQNADLEYDMARIFGESREFKETIEDVGETIKKITKKENHGYTFRAGVEVEEDDSKKSAEVRIYLVVPKPFSHQYNMIKKFDISYERFLTEIRKTFMDSLPKTNQYAADNIRSFTDLALVVTREYRINELDSIAREYCRESEEIFKGKDFYLSFVAFNHVGLNNLSEECKEVYYIDDFLNGIRADYLAKRAWVGIMEKYREGDDTKKDGSVKEFTYSTRRFRWRQ